MIQDNPINDLEIEKVETFNKYGSNLYTQTDIIELEEEEYNVFTVDKVENCLNAYLASEEPNYERIKWLYRRLSQVRVDSAILYTIENIDRLTPAINEIVNYFTCIGESRRSSLDLNVIGDDIFSLLSKESIDINLYLKISILSLFSSSTSYNHVKKLMSIFRNSSEGLKREIIFAVYKSENDLYSWIFGLKEQAENFNDWTRRAYYIACSKLIAENKRFYLKSIKTDDILEKIIIRWALDQGKLETSVVGTA